MKTSPIIMICSFILLVSCQKKETHTTNEMVSGIEKANMDTTASPADNFYQYACGGWIQNHPIPDEYSRYGNFDRLAEQNQEQLKELIEDLASKWHSRKSVSRKIARLYKTGMDSSALAKQGNKPIQSDLQRIADIKDKQELVDVVAEMHNNGINPFFFVYGDGDPDNSCIVMAFFHQNGLGIGDRDYYLKPEHAQIRKQYKSMISKLFQLSGYHSLNNNAKSDQQCANDILQFETQLATISWDNNALRDPIRTTNRYSMTKLKSLMPNFDLTQYLQYRQIGPLDNVNISEPSFFKELNQLINTTDLETIKAYLAWNIISDAANYLSDDFSAVHFEFYGHQLTGAQAQQPRWKRVVSTVNDLMGEALGQMYVEKYFSPEAKERMIALVANLKKAFSDRIRQNTWMNAKTKEKAIHKLEAMIVKVGYPDEWRDYSDMDIKRKGYYGNVLRARRFETAYQMSKIGHPTDPTLWQMSPQTVNAYYNPSTNEICFPAGILQPPFFNANADDAVNYGAIGVVIGHEMTHGFDDQGRLYDQIGNLNDWWKDEDATNFKQRTQVLVNHFNKIEVAPSLFANGEFTLGENIADNGGLNIAYVALQKAKKENAIKEEMDGFSADERFFIAYANVWACNIRDAEIVRRTQSDPHSLAKWRVNGTLPHVDAFASTFQVSAENKMYIKPELRARIW